VYLPVFELAAASSQTAPSTIIPILVYVDHTGCVFTSCPFEVMASVHCEKSWRDQHISTLFDRGFQQSWVVAISLSLPGTFAGSCRNSSWNLFLIMTFPTHVLILDLCLSLSLVLLALPTDGPILDLCLHLPSHGSPTDGPIPDLCLDLFMDMSVPHHDLHDLKIMPPHYTERWKSGRRTQSTHTHTHTRTYSWIYSWSYSGAIPGLRPGSIACSYSGISLCA
jgi:hypothetical protein